MRVIYLVIAIIGVILASLPFMFVYHLLSQTPSTTNERVGLSTNITNFYVKISFREYIITAPLAWNEMTWSVWSGYGSFEYNFPNYAPDINMYVTYLTKANRSCEKLKDIYKDKIDTPILTREKFLLQNNCYWFKKLVLSTEKSWYASLSLIGYFKKQYIEKLSTNYYWIFTLVYSESDKLHVKFYNVINTTELNELVNDIKNLLSSHEVLFLYPMVHKHLWYERYQEILERKIPFALLYYEEESKLPSNYTYSAAEETLRKIVSAIDPRFAGLSNPIYVFWTDGMIIKNGRVDVIYDTTCKYFIGMKCIKEST